MGQDPEELTTDTTTTGMATTGLTTTAAPVPGATTTPADIEATRASLSRDIDELTDKVSPARVVDRQKQAAKSKVGGLRDKVMGAAPDLGDVKSRLPGGGDGSGPGAGDRAHGVADSVSGTASGAVDTLGSRAQGNPLAAGLIAFGAGMLISALIPASDKEAQLAAQAVDAAKEHGQPLVDQAKSVGQDIAGGLKEQAVDSAQQVKETAQESVQTVKEEGQSSAATLKDEGQSSAQTVKQDATPG